MSRHRFIRMTLASVTGFGVATLAEAVSVAASTTGVPSSRIMSKQRDRATAHARQEAMRLAHETGAFSLPDIGRFFGGLDHTTIKHGIEAATKRKAE